MSETESPKGRAWLLAVFTAFGAALLSSLFTVWLTEKEIVSQHTSLVFERQLSTYEELMSRLIEVQRFVGSTRPSSSSGGEHQSPDFDDLAKVQVRIHGYASSDITDYGEFIEAYRRLDEYRYERIFYLPSELDVQLDIYLAEVTRRMLEITDENPLSDDNKAVCREYTKTLSMIHKALGMDKLPFRAAE